MFSYADWSTSVNSLSMPRVKKDFVHAISIIAVGDRVNAKRGWEPIINKFNAKLAKWKSKLLSIGGRSTLITSVLGSLGTYYMSLFKCPKTVLKVLESKRARFFWGGVVEEKKMHWIKWDAVLASKEKGGLGISSLQSLSEALIQKWRWRMMKERDALWVRVLEAMYGTYAGVHGDITRFKAKGVWGYIIRSLKELNDLNIIPYSTLKKVVGDGKNTLFWLERWYGDILFKDNFDRLYSLELNKTCMVSDRLVNGTWAWNWRNNNLRGAQAAQLDELMGLVQNCNLGHAKDNVEWNMGGTVDFMVKDSRKWIDDHKLPLDICITHWMNCVPRKVNIIIWRFGKNKIPTRDNLHKKGIDIPPLLCPMCSLTLEDRDHIFFECSMAQQIWIALASWTGLYLDSFHSPYDMIDWIDNASFQEKKKLTLLRIVYASWWWMWKYRNDVVFAENKIRKNEIVDSIKGIAYAWSRARNRHFVLSFDLWLINPFM